MEPFAKCNAFDADIVHLERSEKSYCTTKAQVVEPTCQKRKVKDNGLNIYERSDGALVAPIEETKRQRISNLSKAERPVKRILCRVPSCNRIIVQRVYRRHLRSVHGQGPVYECNDCDLVFYRRDSFKRHQDAQHEIDNKTQCLTCGAVVAKRRFREHCKSLRCRNSGYGEEDTSTQNALEQFDAMFAEIIQEFEIDSCMLQYLGFESVCDPLLISFRFLFIAMQNHWSKDTTKSVQPRGESVFLLDMLELRGLSMRTILRQSSEEPNKEELEGAIEIFELAELLYSCNSTQPQLVAKKFHNTNSIFLPQNVRKAILNAYDSCRQTERRLSDTLSFEFEYLGTTLAVQVLHNGVRNGFLELLSLDWTSKLKCPELFVEQGCDGDVEHEKPEWLEHQSRSTESNYPARRFLLYGA